MKPSETLKIEHGTTVQVNGLHMYYETYGAGIPVLLIHGGLETCQMWAPVLPAFSAKYQVYTPDSRSHGRTDNPSGKITYRMMGADFAEFIQKLGLHKPFVIGYSDGGQAALELAMNYPGLVRGYGIGAISKSMTEDWRHFLQGPLGFDGPRMVDFARLAQANPDLIKSLQEKHDVHHSPGYWKRLLAQISANWLDPPTYTKEDFAKIIDPLLLWCGDRDVFCPPEQSLEMYHMVNRGELAVIPNADHFSMLEQIDLAIKVLFNFMARVTQAK